MRARRPAPAPIADHPGTTRDRLLALVPVLLAVPVLVGIAVSIGHLLTTAVPDADFLATVNNDAEALRAGEPLYRDPADGYTGMLYTPLLPAVVAALFAVELWSGWAILIGILSSLTLLGLVALVAYRPPGRGAVARVLGAGEALGMGALAWLLVACVQISGLYSGRIDQPAWALALTGLALVPAAMGGGPRARIALVIAVLALSAGFWTRQNTVVAPVTAVLWSAFAARSGESGGRTAAALAAALAGLNLAVLGVLALLTRGWEPYFNFVVPGRHSLGDLGPLGPANLVRYATELLGVTVLGFGLLVVLVLVLRREALGAAASRARRRVAEGSRRLRAAAVLAAAGLVGMAAVGGPYLLTVGAGRPLDTGLEAVALGGLILTGVAAGWLAIAFAVVLERSGTADRRRRLARAGLRRSPVLVLCAAAALFSFLKLSALPVANGGLGWLVLSIGASVGIGSTLAALVEAWIRMRRWRGSDPRVPLGAGDAAVGYERPEPRGVLRHAARWATAESYRARLVGLFAAFLVLDVLATFYMRQKLGGDDHYYIGVAWTLGLLCASTYRRARASVAGARLAPAAVFALFVLFALASPRQGPNAFDVGRGTLVRGGESLEPGALAAYLPATGLMPAVRPDLPSEELRAYAATHSIYDSRSTDPLLDTRGALYPHFDNWYGLVAAGGQPGYLIRALVERRFDAVRPFDEGKWSEEFASGRGRFESDLIWKLNRVIDANYGDRGNAPEDFRERRPGRNRASWMARCFGPFRLAGSTWRINHGGGFWCRGLRGVTLTLVQTRAAFSDVRTEEPVRSARGALVVAPPRRGGAFEVSLEPEDGAALRIRGEATRTGRLRLLATGLGRPPTRWTVPPGRPVRLRFSGALGPRPIGIEAGGRRIAGVPTRGLEDGAVLRLGGSRGSRARFALERLELR